MAIQAKGGIWGGILLVFIIGIFWIGRSEKISISPNRPLIWRDFKQVKVISGKEAINATCFSTVDFSVNRMEDEGEFKRIDLNATVALHDELTQVALHFLARADKATKKQVLEHENGHFTIAQIVGRRIVHAVDNFLFDKTGFQVEMDSIIRSHYKDWSQLDRDYDLETTNPRNAQKQKEWNSFFKKELNKLERI